MHPDHLPAIHIFLQSTLPSLFRVQDAYLDPGSGSYLLQLLIAGLLGGLFMLRNYWGRVKGFFLGLFSKEEDTSSDDG